MGELPLGWPQPNGTILEALDAALQRTSERYPMAGRTMAELDKLPRRIRRQLEADLCNQLGMALHAAQKDSPDA